MGDERTVESPTRVNVAVAIAKAKAAVFESGTDEQYASAELRLRIARSACEIGTAEMKATAVAQLEEARRILEDHHDREKEKYEHPKAPEMDAPYPASFAVLLQEMRATVRIGNIDEIIIFIREGRDVDWDAYKIPPLQEDDVRIAVPHPTLDGVWVSGIGMFHRRRSEDC
ncbi:MAG: hypothetical protein LVQ95_04040 [Candidatus Micrarchaeales archaeon]|nr:hypothetical protein [Candidatus Micrarchaeales archaeon]